MIRDPMLTDVPLAVLARVPEERQPLSSFRKAIAPLDRIAASRVSR